MTAFNDLSNAVIEGNKLRVEELVQSCINDGEELMSILEKGLVHGMFLVGKRFKEGEMFIPEVMLAANAMKAGVELLRPFMEESDMPSMRAVVLGTVEGDQHDIGKNLVGMMIESAGFKVIDLGVDVSPQKFIEAYEKNKPEVVGLSALLTTTMPAMKKTIDAFNSSGLREKVTIIIGGAPVTQKYADEIGADGYAEDAVSASELVASLVKS